MLSRAAVFLGGQVGKAQAGVQAMSMAQPIANATAAGTTLSAQEITSGWIQRSNGGGAGFNDTWPSADSIIQAIPDCAVGDCWDLWYQNTVAFAMTFVAGTGIISGTGTLNCAASVTRLYRHTILSNKPQSILVGNNSNGTAILTGFSAAMLATIMPGMGVTGTNVQANAVVLGLNYGDGTTNASTGGQVTISSNCTGTNLNIPFTFFPRIRLDALGVLAA